METKTYKAVKIIDDDGKEIEAIEITTISKHIIRKDMLERQKQEVEEKLNYFTEK
jgi:hypothetical protein